MGERARVLVSTPGDPPVATIWLHWGGDRLDLLTDRLRSAQLGDDTASATARAFQLVCGWMDEGLSAAGLTPDGRSVRCEQPFQVFEAGVAAKGTDHGCLCFDWLSGEAFVVTETSVEVVPS